ncbi:MAG: Rrf2 family transcriptional regulator [Chloroflexi bacterium]|nr:Rrf2 family transcriptional regulator [Chloroflexota bacterium]
MKVSSRGEYGLRALYDLAEHYNEGTIPSSDIATRQHIPQNYLNQLLIVLRRSGLIESERGRNGGHRLARPPHKITLSEAVRALDGTTAPVECIEDVASCDDHCAYCNVWREVQSATDNVLDKKTLADVTHTRHIKRSK